MAYKKKRRKTERKRGRNTNVDGIKLPLLLKTSFDYLHFEILSWNVSLCTLTLYQHCFILVTDINYAQKLF